MDGCIDTCMDGIHAYIHTHIHAYMHTYIHVYIFSLYSALSIEIHWMHTNADYLAADPLRPSDTQKLSTPTGNTTRGKASATERHFKTPTGMALSCGGIPRVSPAEESHPWKIVRLTISQIFVSKALGRTLA